MGTRKLLLLHLPITSTQPKSITMPRNGDGSSDNGPIDATQNVAHGIPEGSKDIGDRSPAPTRLPLSPRARRARVSLTCPLPVAQARASRRETTWDRARLAKFV